MSGPSKKKPRQLRDLRPITTPVLLYFVVLASVVVTLFLADEAKIGALTVGLLFGVVLLGYSVRKFATGQAHFGDPDYQIGFSAVFLSLGTDEIGPSWLRIGGVALGLLIVFAEVTARRQRTP